MGNAYRCT